MEEAKAASAIRRDCSILCVEDESETCDLIRRILPEHRLVVAATAREALARLYSRPFDAYLLEYYLPDWTGVQLCREIRKTDPHVPVIFYTTAAREDDRTRAMRAGASAYLVKPVDPDSLRARIGALLTLSISESLKAKVEEERVINEALRQHAQEAKRLAEAAKRRGEQAIRRSEQSLENVVRVKALAGYLSAGGTQALFEEAWPALFGSARTASR